MVRSKSEALIAMSLYSHNIPFRYEAALQIGAGIIYPDFTIRHPASGKIIYWEHFGLMDDSSYRQRTVSKLQFYISHGYIPNIHLITTYETRENPLGTDEIERIIAAQFL